MDTEKMLERKRVGETGTDIEIEKMSLSDLAKSQVKVSFEEYSKLSFMLMKIMKDF
jgi:hypothetical protein